MRKVITLVLYNRPDYTKAVLHALRQCDGIGEYLILPHIEPGNEEVLALARGIDFAETRITLNTEKFGIGRNTYLAWQHGLSETDFIIHMEDDTVPARDCLRFMEHCREAYQHDQEIFNVASYHRAACPASKHYEVARRNGYTCWLIGIWKDRWEWINGRWSQDPARYASHLAKQLLQYHVKEVYPRLSRCQNIGAERGVHVPSAQWHRMHHHTEHWAGNFDLGPGRYFEHQPLVTAVMITGMNTLRYSLARIAMDCFKQQTYQNKELLIINHGEQTLFDGSDNIREVRFKKSQDQTVGDLRNLGLQFAKGDFVISWDDDDWHHPDRMRTQLEAQCENAAVFLRKRIHYSFENGCAFYNVTPGGGPGTILHPAKVQFAYPSQPKGSDTVFAHRFKKRISIANDPALYIRFCHGMNLWGADHIMGKLGGPSNRGKLHINESHKQILRTILQKYKGWNPELSSKWEPTLEQNCNGPNCC